MAASESNKDKGMKSQMHPGDDAPLGTPGTGENICPTCKGSGEVNQKPCPDCGGSGKVIEGIGGA
jgi:DnaJ-class molecular chaperone